MLRPHSYVAVVLNENQIRDLTAFAEPWLRYQYVARRFPSLVAGLIVDKRTVLQAAYGHADVESGREATARTPYRIASHSKMLTAIAVLRLREAGLLSLEDRIADWVPSARELGDVTVRDVLSHQGGLQRDPENGAWQTFRFPTRAQARAESRGGVDVFPPLDRFKYSNLSFAVLGEVIERATNQTYAQVMRDELIRPLRLRDTEPDLTDAIAPRLATGYTRDWPGEPREPFPAIDTRAYAPATGFAMSIDDMCTVMRALVTEDPRLLTARAHRELRSPIGGEYRPGLRYGLGMMSTNIADGWVYGHGGGFPGHITRTMFDPDTRFGASVFVNAIDAPTSDITSGLQHTARRLAATWDEYGTPARKPRRPLTHYVGTFRNEWSDVAITRCNRQLVMLALDSLLPFEEPARLEPLGGDRFRIHGGIAHGDEGEDVSFTFDRDGTCRELHVAAGTRMDPFDY